MTALVRHTPSWGRGAVLGISRVEEHVGVGDLGISGVEEHVGVGDLCVVVGCLLYTSDAADDM
eukprot:2819753-Alexandrium_andersonii.AAC.1